MSDYQETFALPFELTNSNNGRGHHWGGSAKIRKQFEAHLRKMRMIRSPFPFPVKITVTRVLGKGQRLWDFDSIGRGNSKELIDSLVSCGWFHDDSPKYITGCDYRQDESRRSYGPLIEIRIEKSSHLNKDENKN